jgi:hypothetical protein
MQIEKRPLKMTDFRIGDIVSNGPGIRALFTAKITSVRCDGLFFIGEHLGPYHASDLRRPTPNEMANYRENRLEEIAGEREMAEYDRDYAECVLRGLDKEERRLKND